MMMVVEVHQKLFIFFNFFMQMQNVVVQINGFFISVLKGVTNTTRNGRLVVAVYSQG